MPHRVGAAQGGHAVSPQTRAPPPTVPRLGPTRLALRPPPPVRVTLQESAEDAGVPFAKLAWQWQMSAHRHKPTRRQVQHCLLLGAGMGGPTAGGGPGRGAFTSMGPSLCCSRTGGLSGWATGG